MGRHADGLSANLRRLVGQCGEQSLGVECIQTVERPQGMQTRRGVLPPAASGVNCLTTPVALPSTSNRWAVSRRQAFCVANTCTSWPGVARSMPTIFWYWFWPEPRRRMRQIRPCAAPSRQLIPAAADLGDPFGMFDPAAVEIGDVQGAVGAGGQKHGMKPGIGRGQKLAIRHRSLRDERRTVGHQFAAMNEIAQRFADKRIADIVGAQGIAAENRQAAEGVVEIDRLTAEGLRRRADRVDPRIVGRIVNVAAGQVGQLRIAIQNRRLQQRVAQRDRVPRGEPLAPVVAAQPELAATGHCLKFAAVGPEAEVAAGDRNGPVRRILRRRTSPLLRPLAP